MNVFPTPADRVRYTLFNKFKKPLITDEPIGWKEDEKTLSRQKNYHGVVVNISAGLKFITEAREYLIDIYNAQGINASVFLTVEEKHSKTDEWKRVIHGYLDFSTCSYNSVFLEIKINSGNLHQLIQNRINDEFELTRLTSVSNTVIPPLETKTATLDGRKILLNSKLEAKESFTSINFEDEKKGPFTVSTQIPFPEIVFRSDESIDSVPALSRATRRYNPYDSTNKAHTFFYSDASLTGILDTVLNLSFVMRENDDNSKAGINDVKNVTMSIAYVIYKLKDLNDPDTFEEVSTTTIYNDPSPLSVQNRKVTISNLKKSISIKKGESVALYIVVKGTGDGSFFPAHADADYQVLYEKINATLEISQHSFFKSTEAKVIMPHEFGERLVEIICGEKKFYSEYFGRTDIQRNGDNLYKKEGEGSHVAMSHGLWIRGFDDKEVQDPPVYKPPTSSLKDYLTSFIATHNLGMGIEYYGNETTYGHKERVRVEPLSYFYNKNVTIKLGSVSNIKRRVASEFFYSSIEVGYDKGGEYEEANGLLEYNSKSNFTTVINRIDNKYSKISKFRADSYGMELARRKQREDDPAEDTRFDEHIFMLDLKKGTLSNLEFKTYLDDFTSATKVYDVNTAYNLNLSPVNCILRHGWVISAGLNKYPNDKILFSSSKGNSNLTFTKNGKTFSENGVIINKDLDPPRYENEWIEFDYKVGFEEWEQINGLTLIEGKSIPNFYGLVEFQNENNETERGFLFEVKPNGKGKWKLLKLSNRNII